MMWYTKLMAIMILVLSGILLYVVLTASNGKEELEAIWQVKLDSIQSIEDDLKLERADLKLQLDTIRYDRKLIIEKLDSIQKIKNETDIPIFKPVPDDKLLDSILYYARK